MLNKRHNNKNKDKEIILQDAARQKTPQTERIDRKHVKLVFDVDFFVKQKQRNKAKNKVTKTRKQTKN